MKSIYVMALVVLTSTASAGEPNIDSVKATQAADGTWRFDVTISHPDTGWDHYADGWRILDMEDNELGLRVLHHPHVTEQPFTRSLSGVRVPEGAEQVKIQARDHPAGWNESTTVFSLP